MSDTPTPAEPEADAIALRMFVDSLRACSDPTKRRAADVIEKLLNSFSDVTKQLAEFDPDPVVCGCHEAQCPHTPIAKLPRAELVKHFRERIKAVEADRDTWMEAAKARQEAEDKLRDVRAYAVQQRDALERARGCIQGLLARTPVRDVSETLAEIDAALAQSMDGAHAERKCGVEGLPQPAGGHSKSGGSQNSPSSTHLEFETCTQPGATPLTDAECAVDDECGKAQRTTVKAAFARTLERKLTEERAAHERWVRDHQAQTDHDQRLLLEARKGLPSEARAVVEEYDAILAPRTGEADRDPEFDFVMRAADYRALRAAAMALRHQVNRLADVETKLQWIVALASWDDNGAVAPTDTRLSWDSVGRMALDYARAALIDLRSVACNTQPNGDKA